MQADLPGTLARVAATGYKEVEFAGYFNRSPSEIRELLTRNGLSAPSAHISLDEMRKNWQKVVDDAKTIGHEWIVAPWLPESERPDLNGWKRLAAELNTLARRARDAGLRFAYHNHDFEFVRVGSGTGYDVLLGETDPSLVDFEMDLYWTVKAGANPLALFTRYPKRFPMVHVKDSMGPPDHRMTEVGKGSIDFRSIFAASDVAGIQHYIVEHDQPANAFESIRTSFDYLKALEY